MRIPAIVFAFVLANVALAQGVVESHMTMKMDQGVELMEQRRYEEADEVFKYVLKNMTKLPSEMAFYFGKNSYYLGKYKQSINWLNKYIQLKGTQGRYHEEASKFLRMSEESYREESMAKTQAMKDNIESSNDFDCGGLGKMLCPVCHGEGVVIKQGPFEPIYQTCPYSAGKAYLTCEEYNLFMRGELKPKTN